MNQIENIVIQLDILKHKLNLLTPWQRLVICLYLLGWSLDEIASRAQITRQAVSFHFAKAKKIMEVELNGQGN